MHSSKVKAFLRVAVFIALFIAIDTFLGYGLISNTFARISIHSLDTQDPQDVFIGTSKGMAGIDPEVVDSVTGRTSVNICLGSTYPVDYLYLIKEAARTGSPERVIYELDPSYYTVSDYQGIEDPFIMNAMPASHVKTQYYFSKYFSQDFRIGVFSWMFHRNELPNMADILTLKSSKAFLAYDPSIVGDGTSVYHSNGFLYYNRIPIDKEVNYLIFDDSMIKEKRIKDLENMITYCKKQGIELITVVLPVPSDSLTERAADYAAADEYFSAFMAKNGVQYYNFNYMDTGFDNSLDGYRDYEGHMWGDTAELFSSLLGQYLK